MNIGKTPASNENAGNVGSNPTKSTSSKNKMKKPKKNDLLVAKALRAYAKRLCLLKDTVSVEEARDLDRALRACSAISDIDRVWVGWRYAGDERGWITEGELKFNPKKDFWEYPDKVYEQAEEFPVKK